MAPDGGAPIGSCGAGTRLEYYAAIAQATRQMLLAARRADWDAVALWSARCETLINELKCRPAGGSLDLAGQRRRLEFLRDMLAADAEIRECAEPWFSEFERMLGSPGSGSRRRP